MSDKLAQLGGQNAALRRKNEMTNKANDTIDLVIQRPVLDHPSAETGGEDYFELKKRIRQLEDDLRRAKADNDSIS